MFIDDGSLPIQCSRLYTLMVFFSTLNHVKRQPIIIVTYTAALFAILLSFNNLNAKFSKHKYSSSEFMDCNLTYEVYSVVLLEVYIAPEPYK